VAGTGVGHIDTGAAGRRAKFEMWKRNARVLGGGFKDDFDARFPGGSTQITVQGRQFDAAAHRHSK